MDNCNFYGRGCKNLSLESEYNIICENPGCSKLDTFNWLRDIPDSYHNTDLVEVRFKNTRKGIYKNVNNLKLRKGDIVAVAPFFKLKSILTGRRLVCLPSSEYCFPLTAEGINITSLIDTAKENVRQGDVSFLEIRGWKDTTMPVELGLKEHSYYLNHVIELGPDPDVLRAGFSSKKQRPLRQHLDKRW